MQLTMQQLCNWSKFNRATFTTKTTQKLHTKNTELHTKSERKSPLFGGGDYVILANSANQQAANDPVKNESYSPLEDGQLKPKK